MATIKAGTYKWNAIVDIPNFTGEFPLPILLPDLIVDMAGTSVNMGGVMDGIKIFDDNTLGYYHIVDANNQISSPCYSPTNGWDEAYVQMGNYGFEQDDVVKGFGQNFTVTEDTDFTTEDEIVFATWFNANAVAQTETTPIVEIIYKDTTISLEEGDSVALHTSGKIMKDDIVVNVASGGSGGGECSGNHIIEVAELPTEDIDENALYKVGDSYYQPTKVADIIIVKNGVASSYKESAQQEGGTFVYYTVDNYENVANPNYLIDDTHTVISFYYDASRDDTFAYADEWISLSLVFGITNGGMITDISEATTDGYYYTIMYDDWMEYIVKPSGSMTITEVGTYNVKNIESVSVDFPTQAVVGTWRFNNSINLDTLPRDLQIVNFSIDNTNGELLYTNFVGMKFEELNGFPALDYVISNTSEGIHIATVYSMNPGEWTNQNLKIVDFGTEPQLVYSAFKEWLVANATPIYTITRTE